MAYIERKKSNKGFPYIDDFGGVTKAKVDSNTALKSLQATLVDVGLEKAKHKVCSPCQTMIWLGILFDTVSMTMSIPGMKLSEIMEALGEWKQRPHATRWEMQSIIGALQFVAKVSPPVHLFINRMLECLRDTPRKGSHTLSWGFKKDIGFFLQLQPLINGIHIMNKDLIAPTEVVELDACLSGCGAWCSSEFYGRRFPAKVVELEHPIAHLELLNLVVAVKLWSRWWAGHRVEIRCDNMNTCMVVMTGKSIDLFMQSCARELYQVVAAYDIDLNVVHYGKPKCPKVSIYGIPKMIYGIPLMIYGIP